MRSVPIRRPILSNLLGILTIAAGLEFAAQILVWHRLFIIYPRWAAIAMLTISVLRLFALAAIWGWSKSGVIAYVLVEVSSVIVWTSVGRLDTTNIPRILGTALLLALLWRIWVFMPWGVLIGTSDPIRSENG